MFGLTFEKLLLVGVLAAVILGPHRLPALVAGVAALVRGLRRTVDAARLRAATELGVPADTARWRALDPRQYDPRRIIAEVLAAPPAARAPGTAREDTSGPAVSLDDVSVPADSAPMAPGAHAGNGGGPAAVRRVRVGTSAHPRWIEVPDDGAEPERALIHGSVSREAVSEVTVVGTYDAPPPAAEPRPPRDTTRATPMPASSPTPTSTA
ncbi:MAG: Sec-independent protein secretion pathway component [Microbacterium sp.]|nr:Sec-independent protein secretion pathway component [Microbacterium sp.]